MGQLLLRDAGTVVPDHDGRIPLFLSDGGIDPLAGAAVLGRIVQQVGEHLPQPLRVAGQRRELPLRVGIIELNALLFEKLTIGIHCVLKLRLNVDHLNIQIEAAVLDAAEFQQLFHHLGQAAGLADNDIQALFEVLGIVQLAGDQRLAPAVDGSERRAQLMGDRGNEFRFHLFVLADPGGHIVDGVDQVADLVVVLLFQLDAVVAGSNAFGGIRNAAKRSDDGADKVHIDQIGQCHDKARRRKADHHDQNDLAVHQAQRRHHAQHALDLTIVGDRGGHRHDPLAGSRVGTGPRGYPSCRDRVSDIRSLWLTAGGQAGRGKEYAGLGLHGQKLQLQTPLFIEIPHIVFRHALVLRLIGGIAGEEVADGLHFCLQSGEHGVEIVVAQNDGKQDHNGNQDAADSQEAVAQPPVSDAAPVVEPEFFLYCCYLCHFFHPAHLLSFCYAAGIRSPIYSRNPRPS